jgi:Bacteriophage minor capsid protein
VVLDDLGAYLQAEGLGTLGTDLFLGTMPLDAPNVVTQDAVTSLEETPGFPAQYVHTPPGVSVEHPVIQILVRGAPYDYAGARSHAQDIFLALGKISNQTLSGTYYFWCLPLQSVFRLRQDDFARPIMTAQFRCAKAV